VRTASDKLYLFGAKSQYVNGIEAYWTSGTGLPTSSADFAGSAEVIDANQPISVDTAYNGGNIVHVITNTQGGKLKDYPFNTSTNTFAAAIILDSTTPTISGDYIGTAGVSSMVDKNGVLNVSYWGASNHIIYRAYTYDSSTNSLTLVKGPTQIDTAGSANHPSLAISPVTNSVNIAWVSQAVSPAAVAYSTSVDGTTWSAPVSVSTGPLWTSTSFGLNIDQGPSMVFDSLGNVDLLYMENWEQTSPGVYNYGRVHFVTNKSGSWVDNRSNLFTHDPSLAIDSSNNLYVFGHGHSVNTISPITCQNGNNMCYASVNSDGSMNQQILLGAPSGSDSYDASVSVKWGVVGWNRPETVEVLFFNAVAGNYNSTRFVYGHL